MQTRLENLTESIGSLEAEVARLRGEFRRRTMAIIAVVVTVAIVGFFLIRSEIDNAKRIAENNQRLCPVIKVLGSSAGSPASTPRGVEIQREFARLTKEFTCP